VNALRLCDHRPKPSPYATSPADAITVPKAGTDAARMQQEFIATMTNPAAYNNQSAPRK
jgi:hypothetical protein